MGEEKSKTSRSLLRQLQWTGIDLTSESYAAMRSLFADVFALPALVDSPELSVFVLPNYSMVELYGPKAPQTPWRRFGVAVGFDCSDIDATVAELTAAGFTLIESFDGMDDYAKLGITGTKGILTTPDAGKGGGDYRFAFFKAPDGRVYSIAQSTPK